MGSMLRNVEYWLVHHPTISHFEWKRGHTWGASPLFLSLAVFSYLSAVALLRRSSSSSSVKSHILRPISAVHSLVLLLLSLAMAVGCSLSAYFQMPNPYWIFCFPSGRTPPRGPVFFWAYVFYLSKILEFLDTLLILLGRRRLSFLHVYHHAVVVVMCYVWLEAAQSLLPLALVTNAAVHTLMYAYYLLAAAGRRPAWKRVVTDVQIGQFVFSFAASGVMLYLHLTGPSSGCSGIRAWCFNALFNASLLLLFLDFHSKNYSQKDA